MSASDCFSLDRAVMRDIKDRTGLVFESVQAIDTAQESLAKAVLPILVEWQPMTQLPEYRRAIYHRFHTRHATPYLNSLVYWLRTETDNIGIDLLYQDITLVMRTSDCEWLWQTLPTLPRAFREYDLLARLAECPAVASAVKDRLAHDLEAQGLMEINLMAIAQVDDRRIFKWFEDHVNSRDNAIGPIARRVVSRGKQQLKDLEFVAVPPNPIGALVSTEMDLDDVPGFLRQIAKEHLLTIPASVRKGSFLSRVPLDRWVKLPVESKVGDSLNLYFRLEDIDTVEIALVRSASPLKSVVQ